MTTKRKIPSAFNLAVFLLIVAVILSIIKTVFIDGGQYSEVFEALNLGLWDKGGVVFMVQMVFMLLLGQSLAKTPFFSLKISSLFQSLTNSRKTYATVALVSLLGCWVNWGLGLVLGALAANSAAQIMHKKQIPFNFGFLAALGYSGMMLWHSGLSGSSTIKAAENNSIKNMLREPLANAPEQIFISDTVFSTQNLLVSIVMVVAVWLFAKYAKVNEKLYDADKIEIETQKLSRTGYSAIVLASILAISLLVSTTFSINLAFLNPNFIITVLLIALLIVCRNLKSFTLHVERNLKSTSGILLQFPIYFAIMAILQHSGLMESLSNLMLQSLPSSALTYSTFISSGLVNFMVPSGGGQWLIQGPLIVETFLKSNESLPHGILAFAYGDALTNMLQPFWALPLLGITQLSISDLLPHTLKLFGIGFVIYSLAILLG